MSRQKLGQHFLASGKVLERITRAVQAGFEADEDSLVVEIGPGKGALTEHLIEAFNRVVAVELDRELVEELRSRWGATERLTIIEANALRVDWNQWGPGVLTGNLPYYIASALISQYLRQPGKLRNAVFLIQREVAERITARPGTREYGYLSVECQFLSKPEYLFTVPPGAFRPPPKVESAVIRLTPTEVDPAIDKDAFLRFASACFRQKRKTLRNNLSTAYDRAALMDIPELERRAEQLTVAEFIRLGESLKDLLR